MPPKKRVRFNGEMGPSAIPPDHARTREEWDALTQKVLVLKCGEYQLDPKGKKDSVPISIVPTEENPDTYRCEYVATLVGLHSVNVFFAGNPIPKSPFGVKASTNFPS